MCNVRVGRATTRNTVRPNPSFRYSGVTAPCGSPGDHTTHLLAPPAMGSYARRCKYCRWDAPASGGVVTLHEIPSRAYVADLTRQGLEGAPIQARKSGLAPCLAYVSHTLNLWNVRTYARSRQYMHLSQSNRGLIITVDPYSFLELPKSGM